jgi:hypothetical protein
LFIVPTAYAVGHNMPPLPGLHPFALRIFPIETVLKQALKAGSTSQLAQL